MKIRLLLPPLVLAVATLIGAPAGQAAALRDLLGEPAPLASATRTVTIGSNTKYVKVTSGEVVKFVVGDKEFAWSFDTNIGDRGFDLSQIAPPGVVTQPVRTYLVRDPSYVN